MVWGPQGLGSGLGSLGVPYVPSKCQKAPKLGGQASKWAMSSSILL